MRHIIIWILATLGLTLFLASCGSSSSSSKTTETVPPLRVLAQKYAYAEDNVTMEAVVSTTNAYTISWHQIEGPELILDDNASTTPSFEVPNISVVTTVMFETLMSESNGSTHQEYVEMELFPGKFTVDAGQDQRVPSGKTVSLQGVSNIDYEFGVLDIAWSQVDETNESITIVDPDTLNPTFISPNVASETTLLLQLHVSITTDAGSFEDNDTVAITVLPTQTATGLPTTTVTHVGSVVTLNPQVTLPPATTQTHTWTQISGPSVTLTNPNAHQTSFTATQSTTGGTSSASSTTSRSSDASSTSSSASSAPAQNPVVLQHIVVTTPTGGGATTTTTTNHVVHVVDPATSSSGSSSSAVTSSSSAATSTSSSTSSAVSSSSSSVAAPLPAIAILTNPPHMFYEGQTQTLHVSASGGDGNLNYAWTQESGGVTLVIDETDPQNVIITAPTVSQDENVTLKVTVNDGSGNAQVAYLPMTINNIDLQLSVTEQIVPGGHDGTLHVTVNNPVSAPYTYQWSEVNGTSVTIANAATDTPTVTSPSGLSQDYTFQVDVTDALGNTATALTTITVLEGISVDAGPDQTVFEENSVTLHGLSTGAYGVQSIQWSQQICTHSRDCSKTVVTLNNADTLTPTFTAPVVDVFTVSSKQTNIYAFELSVTDTKGRTMTDTVLVSVKPVVPQISITGPSQVGDGSTAYFTCNVQGNTPAKADWGYIPSESTVVNYTQNVFPHDTLELRLDHGFVGTTSVDCSFVDQHNRFVKSESYNFAVYPVPTATALTVDIPGNITIKENQLAPLSVNVSGGTPPYTFTWYFYGGSLGSLTNADQQFASYAPDTIGVGVGSIAQEIRVDVTDSAGASKTQSLIVTTLDNPLSATVTPQPVSILWGDPVTLHVHASGGYNSDYNYLWDSSGTDANKTYDARSIMAGFNPNQDADWNVHMLVSQTVNGQVETIGVNSIVTVKANPLNSTPRADITVTDKTSGQNSGYIISVLDATNALSGETFTCSIENNPLPASTNAGECQMIGSSVFYGFVVPDVSVSTDYAINYKVTSSFGREATGTFTLTVIPEPVLAPALSYVSDVPTRDVDTTSGNAHTSFSPGHLENMRSGESYSCTIIQHSSGASYSCSILANMIILDATFYGTVANDETDKVVFKVVSDSDASRAVQGSVEIVYKAPVLTWVNAQYSPVTSTDYYGSGGQIYRKFKPLMTVDQTQATVTGLYIDSHTINGAAPTIGLEQATGDVHVDVLAASMPSGTYTMTYTVNTNQGSRQSTVTLIVN